MSILFIFCWFFQVWFFFYQLIWQSLIYACCASGIFPFNFWQCKTELVKKCSNNIFSYITYYIAWPHLLKFFSMLQYSRSERWFIAKFMLEFTSAYVIFMPKLVYIYNSVWFLFQYIDYYKFWNFLRFQETNHSYCKRTNSKYIHISNRTNGNTNFAL